MNMKYATTRIAKTLALAAMMLAAPLASQASTADDEAMNACINAFVAANLPKEQRVRVQKEDVPASPISVHARTYKIVLSATGAISGKNYSRGTCIVDRDGAVLTLNGRPLSTKVAAR
jgi:hypothetical protein